MEEDVLDVVVDDSVRLRAIEKLKRTMGKGAVGKSLLAKLADENTLEICLNNDGKLWYEEFGQPMKLLGSLPVSQSTAILQTIAGYHGRITNHTNPILECELPLDGSRFAGQLPPIVSSPAFAIRKKASRIFTLNQYVEAGIMSPHHRDYLCQAIADHKNILVIGGTGSGKTTLLNGLIAEVVRQFPHERICIIEDTGELQCSAENYVQYHTTVNITMSMLLILILRMRPDRILVGETRGPEALDMIDAWMTGHPGGLGSAHATTTAIALRRLKSMISRNPFAPSDIESVIADTVNVLVCINKTPEGRRVQEIREIQGYENGEYISQLIAA